MDYIKRKKKDRDICNICGEEKQLTWDHVPPKSTGNSKEILANLLIQGFPESDKYQKKYQNGIRFRTICQECNNSLIGEYDMDYKNLLRTLRIY